MDKLIVNEQTLYTHVDCTDLVSISIYKDIIHIMNKFKNIKACIIPMGSDGDKFYLHISDRRFIISIHCEMVRGFITIVLSTESLTSKYKMDKICLKVENNIQNVVNDILIPFIKLFMYI